MRGVRVHVRVEQGVLPTHEATLPGTALRVRLRGVRLRGGSDPAATLPSHGEILLKGDCMLSTD